MHDGHARSNKKNLVCCLVVLTFNSKFSGTNMTRRLGKMSCRRVQLLQVEHSVGSGVSSNDSSADDCHSVEG